MEQVTLTRKELYDLVWAQPLSRLAKRYKISDNGLRKICKRMNIPIPAMGHWQKIQYGKKVIITKLSVLHQANIIRNYIKAVEAKTIKERNLSERIHEMVDLGREKSAMVRSFNQ